jgi:hypothetical protein
MPGQRAVAEADPVGLVVGVDDLARHRERPERDGDPDARGGPFGGRADPRPGRAMHAEAQHRAPGPLEDVGAGADLDPVAQVVVAVGERLVPRRADLGVGEFRHRYFLVPSILVLR